MSDYSSYDQLPYEVKGVFYVHANTQGLLDEKLGKLQKRGWYVKQLKSNPNDDHNFRNLEATKNPNTCFFLFFATAVEFS